MPKITLRQAVQIATSRALSESREDIESTWDAITKLGFGDLRGDSGTGEAAAIFSARIALKAQHPRLIAEIPMQGGITEDHYRNFAKPATPTEPDKDYVARCEAWIKANTPRYPNGINVEAKALAMG
jgi:hypothetical protein